MPENKDSKIYELYFLIVLISLLYLFRIMGFLFAPFRKDKDLHWSKIYVKSLKTIFFLTGVRIKVYNHNPAMPHCVMFTSNHQGPLDGPVYSVVLPVKSFALVQPIDLFPWFFRFWVKKIKCVSVFRDKEDKEKCSDALGRKRAIELSVNELKKGEDSMLLFPEGHFEHKYHYLYFHTGAIRIALMAGVDIVPCKIEHSNKLASPNKMSIKPGKIEIIMGGVWDLSKYYGKYADHTLVRRLTKELKEKIENLKKPYEV